MTRYALWALPNSTYSNIYKLKAKTGTRKQIPIYNCRRKILLPNLFNN